LIEFETKQLCLAFSMMRETRSTSLAEATTILGFMVISVTC